MKDESVMKHVGRKVCVNVTCRTENEFVTLQRRQKINADITKLDRKSYDNVTCKTEISDNVT